MEAHLKKEKKKKHRRPIPLQDELKYRDISAALDLIKG